MAALHVITRRGNKLELISLKKSYYQKNSEIEVLKSINLKINFGSIVGLIGDNGAGKTTLIKCICNVVHLNSGKVCLNGKQMTESDIRKNIGVLLEGARNLYHFLTINENINYFGYLNHMDDRDIEKKRQELLTLFDLSKYQNTTVNELSLGMQQKVAIMILMMKDPKILILDEPTFGLDLVSTMKMKRILSNIINDTEKIIIIISHDMSLISSLCNRLILLQHGAIEYDGEMDDIISNDEYIIKLEETSELKKKIVDDGIKYELDDGIYTIISNNFAQVRYLIENGKALSIEKKEVTLEKFLERRLKLNDK
ncbi:MAG: ABC transporter ATP-binding protein [Erysipelotrichaceae bacterium]